VSDPFEELRAANLQLASSAALLRARIVQRLRTARVARVPAAPAQRLPAPPSETGRDLLSWVGREVRKVLSTLIRTWRPTPPAGPSKDHNGRRDGGTLV
jgi:hypothetical protein